MKKWSILLIVLASFSRSFAENYEDVYTGYLPEFETFAESMLTKLNETCQKATTGCSATQCEIILVDQFYGEGGTSYAHDKTSKKEKQSSNPETYRLRFQNNCNSKSLEFEWQNKMLDQDRGESTVMVNENKIEDRKSSFKNLDSYLSAVINNKNWFDWASEIAKESKNWVTY